MLVNNIYFIFTYYVAKQYKNIFFTRSLIVFCITSFTSAIGKLLAAIIKNIVNVRIKAKCKL